MRAFARALCGLLIAGCAVSGRVPSGPTPDALVSPTVPATATPSLAATVAPTATPREDPPVVASEPDAIAAQMATAERAVRDHGVTGTLLAWMGHLQQLTYRRVAARPEWRDAVIAALPSDVRTVATKNLDATAELRATVVPGPNLPTTWRIVEPAPMEDLARYYREAETDFGIPRGYLASIHLVETRMGRIRGTSTAGAQGPMQFLPATWAVYGEGDIESDRDSIRAAARYLRANGAPANMAGALYRYNRSDRYVDAVTTYAEIMRADPDAYRGYYQWQVYYLTTKGDVLLPVGYGR